MLGLGLAAIIVGGIDVFYPIPFELELGIWVGFSVMVIACWFKYMRDKNVENSGQSNYSLETEGVVIKSISPNGRGKVQFDSLVLGDYVWVATSKEQLHEGKRVKIVKVKGQLVEVASI